MKKKLLFCLFLFTACSLESPKTPSWDIPLNIPLADKNYTVEEMAESEEDIIVLEEGLIGFQLHGDLEKTVIGNFITLSGTNAQYNIGLERMGISDISGGVDEFLFDQLYDNAERDHAKIEPVLPFQFQNIRGTKLEDSDFTFVALNSGWALLTVTNNLPVNLKNVVLILIEETTGIEIIHAPVIPAVNVNDSSSVSVDLSGKVVPPASHWTLSGESPGSGGEPVPINQSDAVRLSTKIKEVNISKANSVLPEMRFEQFESLLLEEKVGMEEVAFQKGFLEWQVENRFPLVIDIDFSVDVFKHKITGQSLIQSVHLDPWEEKTVRVDLSDYVAYLTAASPNSSQTVPVQITGGTLGSNEIKVNINSSHEIIVDVTFTGVEVDYCKGWIDHYEKDLGTTEEQSDLPSRTDDLENVEFKSALLHIRLTNTLQVPFIFESEITGYNDGKAVSFFVSEQVYPTGTDGNPADFIIEYDHNNSTILDFVNLLPETYTAKSRVLLGDGQTIGYLASDQFVETDFTFTIPAKVKFNEQTVVLDTSKILVDPEDMPAHDSGENRVSAETTEKMSTAEILASVTNHLPIGCKVFFHLDHDSTQIVDHPQVVLGPIEIIAGKTNMQGRVVQASEQQVVLKISKDGIEIFSNNSRGPIPVFIATVLKIPESPQTVQVYSEDYIQVVSLARIIVKLDKENS
ncbi:hypothetical protein JW935_16695 [candidate division KSB1 bacterium]|nr:hypothetical protein [candidate division KSB1 bacterium]